MHLLVYCTLAAVAGTLALRYAATRVLILLATIAFPAITYGRWLLFAPNDTWATYINNLMHQPLLLSGDIDMWAFTAMYIAHTLLSRPKDAGIAPGNQGTLLSIILGPTHASYVAFVVASKEDQQGRTYFRPVISDRLMVAGGVIQLIQVPLWFYFTVRGVLETPTSSIEGLRAIFSRADVLHEQRFIEIFVLSAWFFGVIWTLRHEQGNVADTATECCIVMGVVGAIFIGNIAFAHYLVWFWLRVDLHTQLQFEKEQAQLQDSALYRAMAAIQSQAPMPDATSARDPDGVASLLGQGDMIPRRSHYAKKDKAA